MNRQLDFDGNSHPVTGHWCKDQIDEILTNEPHTRQNDALCIARWYQHFRGFGELPLETLYRIADEWLKYDPRRRRQELRDKWPYDDEERRQNRAKGGPP